MATIKKTVAKKPVVKKQTGGMATYKPSTPFQDYLKNNKGAVASDTVAKSYKDEKGNQFGYFKAENSKNQKKLGKAVSETIKPKAQLGAIVKAIGKGISTGAKVASKGIKTAKANKTAKTASKGFGERSQYNRLSDMKKSENYRAGKGYKDAEGDRDAANALKLKIGIGTAAAYGAAKALEKKKMGGTTKKKC